MQGFKLDSNGDVMLENGKISMISGTDLTAQTLQTVAGTNKGEWFLNEDEGIDFDSVIGKGITEDMQRAEIIDACGQVDQNLQLTEFSSETDKKTRAAILAFTAVNQSGEEIRVERDYSNDIATEYEVVDSMDRLEKRLDGILVE